MSSLNEVLNFIKENKKYLPPIVNEKDIKTVIETGKVSAEQVLNKLARVVNKAKSFEKVVDEINNYNVEKQDKIFNKQLDKITSEINLSATKEAVPEPTKKDLNKSENSIKNTIINHNLEDQSLTIWFKRGSRTLFKDIKEVIYNKLNDFKTLDKAFFQVFYKVNGDKRNTIFSLNNERGMILLSNLLKGDNFELLANNEDNDIIECSDTNKDNINAISYDMLTGIKFFNVDAEQKGINIYTDNGGSFYPYKINKTFENCKPILKTLLKYQITNDLKNNVDMFSYNCLTWALKMSDKFDKTII